MKNLIYREFPQKVESLAKDLRRQVMHMVYEFRNRSHGESLFSAAYNADNYQYS